jgi:hypothetical protein
MQRITALTRASKAEKPPAGAQIVRSAHCHAAGIALLSRPYIVTEEGAHHVGPPDRKAATINKLFRVEHAEAFGEKARAA